ncbi:MAG TPA: DinB family protein [Candidatus Sulfopaludibacter sp.]|nr:DinB family protein [Candidatus Sulfopaludibacter sp.]
MRTRLLLSLCWLPAVLTAQNNLKTTVTQRYFNGVRRNLEAAADAMPAVKFGYKLTDGQMSFAEWLNHSTQRNYADCATLKGEAAPEAAQKVAGLKEKAEVTQALKDSFAYCAAALEGIDDQKVLASPQMTYSLLHVVVHNNEIYGNIAGYLRMSGIVPPSTAGRMGQKGK